MMARSKSSALATLFVVLLALFSVAHGSVIKGSSFKRRALLQGGDGSSSDGGSDSGSSLSPPYANTVTGANDAADRVEASPAVALADSPLSDAELCAVSKQIYGSVPPECANQPQLKVTSLPVKLGPVEEPLSLGVTEDGTITASGGGPPGVDDWNPVAGEPMSKSSNGKKLSAGAVAGIILGVVVVLVVGVSAVVVSKKKRRAAGAVRR